MPRNAYNNTIIVVVYGYNMYKFKTNYKRRLENGRGRVYRALTPSIYMYMYIYIHKFPCTQNVKFYSRNKIKDFFQVLSKYTYNHCKLRTVSVPNENEENVLRKKKKIYWCLPYVGLFGKIKFFQQDLQPIWTNISPILYIRIPNGVWNFENNLNWIF